MGLRQESSMLLKDKLFVGGRWVAPAGSETIEVHNAGNGEVMGRIPAGGEKDADAAVKAAGPAFEAWETTPEENPAEFPQKNPLGLHAPPSHPPAHLPQSS